ncbi:MAG TPA: hypothetical protein VLI72_14855 [Methylibium sp.]|nr:hypothetical protein [Methylibium sp.]
MLIDRFRRLWPAVGLAVTTAVQAGDRLPAAAPADPLDASAPVPAVRHDSIVARHRGHAEQPVAPWKAANDTVGRIGGWREYAREAQAAPGAPPASAPAHRH